MYCDCRGRMFSLLNWFLQFTALLLPVRTRRCGFIYLSGTASFPTKSRREWFTTVILWQTGRNWRTYLWTTVGLNSSAAVDGRASSRFKWQCLHCISYILGVFTKLIRATVSSVTSCCPSARPHGTTRLPLDGFSWNFVFEYFSKTCR